MLRKVRIAYLAVLLAPSMALACGHERWSVKIGTDQDVARVDLNPFSSTVNAMGLFPAPDDPASDQDQRFAPTELMTFTVQGTITLVRREKDGDYHLVLRDGDSTMIVESPAPSCAEDSRFAQQITAVRAKLDQQIGYSLTGIGEQVHPNWQATVTGVGFFDVPHGQTGMAPNAIELHPILDIEFH